MAEKKGKKENAFKGLYNVSEGKIERKGKFCPKCGPGVFMAQHKDRTSCGKCGYTEFQGKAAKEISEAELLKRKAREEKLQQAITKVAEEAVKEEM